ncbi:MAG: hypothetical protein JNM72_14305 [Deltaproteobacteria bacterium]|nr:hypothetical protein [Deltaproteobacteria bacterium]
MAEQNFRLKDLERVRARAALSALSGQRGVDGLEGLPIRMRSQGMVTGLTLLAKRSPALADDIAGYLTETWPLSPLPRGRERLSGLVRGWCALEPNEAALVEAEALRFAEALKLLSKATGDQG